MKTQRNKVGVLGTLAAAGLCALPTGYAQLIFEVDMDPVANGIQATRSLTVGQNFTADIWMSAGTGISVSSYSLSVQFDTTELALNGVPATTEFVPLLPVGAALPGWIVNGGFTEAAGQVSSVGATDMGFNNPVVAGNFWKAASINFTVLGNADNGLADITLGAFAPKDKFKDSLGNDITNLSWFSGYVIPEPQTYAFVAGLTLLGWAGYRRWR